MALSAAQHAFPKLNPHRLNIQRITTCVNALLLASDYKEIYDKDYHKPDIYAFFAATAVLSLGVVSLINRAGKPDLSKSVYTSYRPNDRMDDSNSAKSGSMDYVEQSTY